MKQMRGGGRQTRGQLVPVGQPKPESPGQASQVAPDSPGTGSGVGPLAGIEPSPRNQPEIVKKGPGGARAGAGRPKGSKNASTLDKEAARERLRELVKQHMDPMVHAQIAHAQGLKYAVARNRKSGKFVPVTEELMKSILSGQDVEHESLEIWEKDPSVQAFTDLMNRTIDKPIEQVDANLNHSGGIRITWEAD